MMLGKVPPSDDGHRPVRRRPSAALVLRTIDIGAEAPPPWRLRLRGSFWATAAPLNPELHVHRDRLEVHERHIRRRLVHRVRYREVAAVELVEGRVFADVIITTSAGTRLVAPGIRRRQLAAARPFLVAAPAPASDGPRPG